MNFLTKLAVEYLRKTGRSFIINCNFFEEVVMEADVNFHLIDTAFPKETYILIGGEKHLLMDVIRGCHQKGEE